jgi:hypothetical protein
MRHIALLITVVAGAAGCSQVLGVHDVTVEHRVGGQVRGLWDGVDGVALRLQADGIDTLLAVSANGMFSFTKLLDPGASYTVTVATNPGGHTCVVDGGGTGVVTDADVTSVSIACTGPSMALALSGPWGWTFDPTREVQTFAGSVVVQDVALTISGSEVTSASVNGAAAMLGVPTPALALPLGSLQVPVAVATRGGLSKTYELVFERGSAVLEQAVYGKASNAGAGDFFGFSVALSGDTLAVGARGEASAATGVNPASGQADNRATYAGAVYVFVRSGTTWTQQAYLKAFNADAYDQFGVSVALSGDTLAVGAYGEASAATGVNPASGQADNSASEAGAVYVFVRSGTTWTQQAYLKASNAGAYDSFGISVALAGNTLAVGANGEDSAATGINPASGQADNTASIAGAVYVFVRSGTTWTQQAYLKASNAGAGDNFGWPVAVSGDTLAVGAYSEASAATGVNPASGQADNSANSAGAVYVFVRSGATWTQQAYLKASNAGADDSFGRSVALSGDTLAVGAPFEASAATGVNPASGQADNSAGNAGAVYVFVRSGTTWTQQAYLKASNAGAGDYFGASVALSENTLAVGAEGEASAANGVNPPSGQANNTASGAGAVYVFVRSATTWTQQAYLKASNAGAGDIFGYSVALSGDTLAVGAYDEASAATGVNPATGQADNTAYAAGAVYVFR